MKKLFLSVIALGYLTILHAQELEPVNLLPHTKNRGLSMTETLELRASAREWSTHELSLQDLSDLLWAADGINRPDEGKRTASSAQNAQDVGIYVFMKQGVYVYDALKNSLQPVASGDFRDLSGKTDAPVMLVLIADISKFGSAPPAGAPPAGAPMFSDSLRIGWSNIDVGIISQNISLFCAATGLKTRPRSSFPGAAKMREILALKSSQHILLNHPVGYAKEQ